jgi:hypothetical protein
MSSTLAPDAPALAAHADAPVETNALHAVGQLDLAAAGETTLLSALALVDQVQSYAAAMRSDLMVALVDRDPEDDHDWVREDIATVLRIASGSARYRIDEARDLHQRPGVLAALRDGRLSEAHARAFMRAIATTDDETVRDRVEATILNDKLPDKPWLTPSQLERATRDAVVRADPEGADTRHENARKGRHVWLSTRDGDGMATLGAHLPLDQALLIRATLHDICAGLPPSPDDPRPAEAREADEFLTTMLTGAMHRLNGPLDLDGLGQPRPGDDSPQTGDPASGHRPALFDTEPDGTLTSLADPAHHRAWTGPCVRINLLLTPETLAGWRNDPGYLTGHGTIPPTLTRRFAALGTELRRLVHDPLTGHLLDAAPDVYEFRPRLKDFLGLRSPTCDFPGCSRPARLCEMDHTIPFPHGPTVVGNGGPMDTRHHHLRHGDRGWTLRRDPDGTAHWTTPWGYVLTVRPFDYRITQVGDEDTAGREPAPEAVTDPYPDEPPF